MKCFPQSLFNTPHSARKFLLGYLQLFTFHMSTNLHLLLAMGRVFTTMFEFKGEKHTAMVAVNEAPADQPRFYVRLLDKDFYQLIPEGVLTFTSTHDSLPDSIHSRAAAELFLSIRNAVSSYLSQPHTARE
jgi:hypothetical protein